MKITLYILVVLISLILFIYFYFLRDLGGLELREKDRIYISAAIETADEFKGHYDLKMCGFGLASEKITGNHLINEINLCYDYLPLIEKDEARQLLVAVVESYVEKINNNDLFSEYLYKKPFTPKELYLIMVSHDSVEPYMPNIYSIKLIDGMVTYKTVDADEDHFSNYERETYEDARRIVQEMKIKENNGNDQSSATSK